MPKATWFSETEKVLHLYWKRNLQIERLSAKLSALQSELASLELELREAKRLPSMIAKYGVTPGGRKGDVGYEELMERWEAQIDRLTRIVMNRRRLYAKLKVRLANLKRQQAPIVVIVKRLSPDEQRLLELRYVYRRSNYAIARELHQSEPTIRRMHHRAVTRCAEWLGKK